MSNLLNNLKDILKVSPFYIFTTNPKVEKLYLFGFREADSMVGFFYNSMTDSVSTNHLFEDDYGVYVEFRNEKIYLKYFIQSNEI